MVEQSRVSLRPVQTFVRMTKVIEHSLVKEKLN